MAKSLSDVRACVARAKAGVEGGVGGDRLKRVLAAAQVAIGKSKRSGREAYELLLVEERSLERDLEAYGAHFEAWEREGEADHLHRSPVRRKQRKNQDLVLPPPVAAFEAFVEEEGGRTGGWEEPDHAEFVKLWRSAPLAARKDDARDAMARKMARKLPMHSEESIASHIEWYLTYTRLLGAKKQAIAEWRKTERERRAAQQAEADAALASPEMESRDRERDLVRGLPPSSSSGRVRDQDRVRQAKKRKIETYRVKKAKQAVHSELLSRAQAEAREAAAAAKRAANSRKRAQVARWARAKEAQEARAQQAQEVARKSDRVVLTDDELHRLHLRDLEMARSRKAAAAAKRARQTKKALAQVLDNPLATGPDPGPRDPSRLLKPTAAHQARVAAIANPEHGTLFDRAPQPSYVKRSVPSWRPKG